MRRNSIINGKLKPIYENGGLSEMPGVKLAQIFTEWIKN